jgi:hypothetical protein
MTAQGNAGARTSSAELPDFRSVPVDDAADTRAPNVGADLGTSRCGDETSGKTCGEADRPRLWKRLLHYLMRTLGGWTI